MAFVTVYEDQYRAKPILPNPAFLPDVGWADLNGQWLQAGGKSPEVLWTDEQKAAFLKRASQTFFWTSTYMNDYCNNITPENRPKPFIMVRSKKIDICAQLEGRTDEKKKKEEKKQLEPIVTKPAKESELMRSMREIFERDKQRKVKKPMKTARRILGYGGPYHYQCETSSYQQDICFPAYIYMRDNLIKRPKQVDGRQPFSETVFY